MLIVHARTISRGRAGRGKNGALLCASLLLGGMASGERMSRAQVSRPLVQAKTGGALSVHELSLLANAPLGNVAAIEGAISRGADVNARDAEGRTALMLAADYNSWRGGQVSDEFKRLLKAEGVSSNISGYGDGGFIWRLNSAADLDSQAARYLLKEEAVQHPDPATGRPFLEWHPTKGNTQVVQALIRHGADVNLRDRSGATVLIHAARNANTTVLRLLLQNGADVNARDGKGRTALGYAAGRADAEGIKALMAGGAVADARSADGPLLLYYAVAQRDNAQARSLLTTGAGVSAEGIQAALRAAVSSSNAEAVDLLVQRGADVNVAGDWTPMQMSLRLHNERMTELLLKKGADPNGKDVFGQSHFLEAVRMGSPQLIQAFLDSGADANTRDAQGETPLLRAMWGFGGVFRSDPDDTAGGGNGRRGDTRQANTLATARLLLAKGADVNAADNVGETPLLRAVHLGMAEVVSYLIEHGANVNARTIKGETPLAWAIRSHQEAIANALRAAGAKE